MFTRLRTATRFAAVAGLATAVVVLGPSADVAAHSDDPKAWSELPPYHGAIWRKGSPRGPLEEQGGFPSQGVRLESWIPLNQFAGGSSAANDCWGYTSQTGREYAILGLTDGTGFVEITDPANPNVVNTLPGPNSIWRDIKTYGNFAYAVTEGLGEGIQVFDLSLIDNGIVWQSNTINTGGNTDSHNVALDPVSGFLYRCGGGSNDGIRVYSLANPGNPQFVGEWHDRYCHDAQVVTYTSGPYAGRQIAYLCSGFNGGSVETGLDVLDVTDKQNIVSLAQFIYPNGAYSHQAWLSPDKQYLYLNDELDEDGVLPTTTYCFHVGDPANPTLVGNFTNGNTAVGHNLYTEGNLIFEANYRSGVRIFDATDPQNPVEFAFFDTWPEDDLDAFNGLWSNFPFFNSGLVIGSDREKGLFVWKVPARLVTFDYPSGRPAMLASSGTSIDVTIDERTPGVFATGSALLHYDTGAGFVTTPLTDLGGGQYEASIPALPCGTEVTWYVSAETTEGDEVRSPGAAPTHAFHAVVADGEAIDLDDDAETDPGWTVSSDGAASGLWERGVPVDDPAWTYDPVADGDGSGQAWLTDNGPGNTDVDNGSVTLESPDLDLSAAGVSLRYLYYLELTNTDGTDRLLVEISTHGAAGPWTQVAVHDTSGSLAWREHVVTPADFAAAGVVPSAATRVRFTVNDGDAQSIVEAGIDGVRATRFLCNDPGGCPGDFDDSGSIGFGDLNAMLSAWGACPPSCPWDLDGTGSVGFSDLNELLGTWGACAP